MTQNISEPAADDFAAENYELDTEENYPEFTSAAEAQIELSLGYDPDAVATPEPLSTQERNPGSAVIRTILQVGLPAFLSLGVVLPEILAVIEENMPGVLPEGLRLWLLGAAGVLTGASAAIARIMAIPAVNDFLRQTLPWLAPENNVGNREA